MALGVIVILAWMALEVVVILATIAWGFQHDQWKDIEEPKYRMLLDLPMQPWPGQEKPDAGPEADKTASGPETRR